LVVPDPEGLDPYPAITAVVGVSRSPPPQVRRAVDPLAVAAGMNPASSGWLPLAQHVREQGSLGCVAVLGATGMAGGLAVQAAFALGAERVVAAGRDREQLERLTATGATTVELDAPDADAALAAAFGAPTPTLVLDYVWGPVAEQAFAALARRGLEDDSAAITYTQIGSLAGATAALPASLLRSRNLRVVGSGAGSTSRAAYLEHLPRLLGLIADGTLTVDYSAYELASVAAAWEHRGRSRAVLVP
jgi:NADPH:quinone reductase-like Zn-dependent oxidoreductase